MCISLFCLVLVRFVRALPPFLPTLLHCHLSFIHSRWSFLKQSFSTHWLRPCQTWSPWKVDRWCKMLPMERVKMSRLSGSANYRGYQHSRFLFQINFYNNRLIAAKGAILGAGLITAIKSKFSSLAVEGVTDDASLLTNMRADGASPVGVASAKNIYEMAASKCPDTTSIQFANDHWLGPVLTFHIYWQRLFSRRCHSAQSNRVRAIYNPSY